MTRPSREEELVFELVEQLHSSDVTAWRWELIDHLLPTVSAALDRTQPKHHGACVNALDVIVALRERLRPEDLPALGYSNLEPLPAQSAVAACRELTWAAVAWGRDEIASALFDVNTHLAVALDARSRTSATDLIERVTRSYLARREELRQQLLAPRPPVVGRTSPLAG